MAADRGICPDCARTLGVRKNGTVRKHRTRRGVCPGSTKPAIRLVHDGRP